MQGIDAHACSGETESDRRLELEDAPIANEVKVLVATAALGMGAHGRGCRAAGDRQRPVSPFDLANAVRDERLWRCP